MGEIVGTRTDNRRRSYALETGELTMLDRFFKPIHNDDMVFYHHHDERSGTIEKFLAKIIDIQPTEIEIVFQHSVGLMWTKNWQLEYISPEKFLLWKLEN
jgi:hypothetical protein